MPMLRDGAVMDIIAHETKPYEGAGNPTHPQFQEEGKIDCW